MYRYRLERILDEIIENIQKKDKKKLRQVLKETDITFIDDEYILELLDALKNEIVPTGYSNKGYCMEIIREIADTLELKSIEEQLEGNINPDYSIILCPNCKEAIKLSDNYIECECKYNSNY